jgi:hypothetical protein
MAEAASLATVRDLLRPDFLPDLPWPAPNIIVSVRHRVKRLVNGVVDLGWFGFRPLETHVVVCGFPRSGSTLLQLIVESCVSDLRTFGREYEAVVAAPFALRNHPFMLTKDPDDIFYIDQIRSFYAERRAEVRFVITLRDPRGVLTSVQDYNVTNQPGGYFVEPDRWSYYHDHVRNAQRSDDVVTVEYQDLVCRPDEVQKKLVDFLGWHVHTPFERFDSSAPRKFDDRALNGRRPLDKSRVDAWRAEKHRERICRLLREIPDLPQQLIELGYEFDEAWVRDYLPEGTPA